MPSSWRLPSANLSGRLDASFHAPAYLDLENRLRSSGLRVAPLGAELNRVFKGAFYLLASQYTQSGVPFIRVTQIASGSVDLDDAVYISNDTHAHQRKTAVGPGYLLFAKGGMYRHCAVVPKVVIEANISQDVIGAEPSARLDSYYAVAFLQSKYGRPQLERWEQGNAQPHLSNDGVKSLLFPSPRSTDAQRYIGDKVREAERLRERTRVLDEKSKAALAELLGETDESWVSGTGATGLLPSGGFRTRVDAGRIRGRLDPSGYHPELTAISNRAASSRSFVPLLEVADLVTDVRAKTSSQSALSAYISVLHVLQAGFVDMVAASRYQPESDGRLCGPGDVLLSGINPAANRVGVCPDQSGRVACSPEFSILRARSGVDPHYLAFALRSQVCLRQLLHLGQGTSSSRRRIDEAELPALLVPISPQQHRIGEWMAKRQDCAAASSALTLVARLLVEGLIDGHLAEADLVAAQKALEAGDRGADRGIISALWQNDASDARSVVPNPDALYALLDEPEEDDT